MLVFRNEVPVDSTMTVDDFFQLTNAWIYKGPHTTFTQKDFENLAVNGKISSSNGKEFFEAKLFKSNKIEIAGVKYTKKEDANEWITTIVFNIPRELIVIEVNCESFKLGEILPQVHVPYIMKQLIHWSGKDGFLRVSCHPYNLKQCEISRAKNIMLGKSTQKKPIVYVSATRSNTHVLHPDMLAHKLFGLAHVVVEPNKEFGERLSLEVGKQKPVPGRIGIYFSNAQRCEFMQRYDDPHDVFIDKIQQRIVNITRMASIEESCSWYFLERCIEKQNLELFKKEKEKDYSDFSEAFDAINKNLENENNHLKTENQFLRSENQRLSNEAHNHNSLLNAGVENEFYQGEILSLILEILQKERALCSNEQLRRQHLIDSILAANPHPKRKDEIKKSLKKILSNWQNKMADRNYLKSLGFSFKEDGKHIKLTWNDDSRYTITLSKTPSDIRAGKNTASDAIKILF
ncbi:MAG: hypothetical protein E7055_18820 [Lentisphaerae bacterium]|nr:hypothetical protein [Lentisphaerota bacterium]